MYNKDPNVTKRQAMILQRWIIIENTIMFLLHTEQDSHRLALQKVGFASGLSYVQ